MATELQRPTQHDETILEKAFVREDGQTTLVCPQCSTVRVVPADQYRQRQHRLKVRCSCSHIFSVNLDFRKCYRKPTNLLGVFSMSHPATGAGGVKILNLSLDGACFEADGIYPIQVGQKGRIDFTLDDRKKTRLVREFIVRAVRGNSIGCQFRKVHAFEKELGFYLRFGP